ncbi:MAG: endolytic transglycosylase MltG [Minisyncoccales bacterium]
MKRIIFIFLISFFFLFFLFIFFQKSFSFKTKNPSVFEVKKGEGFFEIGRRLENEGFIKNRYAFYLYAFFKGDWKKLAAGRYKFQGLRLKDIVQKMRGGRVELSKIMIVDGMRLWEIDEILIKNKIIKRPLSSFKIKDFKEQFSFLKDIDENLPLEGFLFPDTYFFYLEMDEKEVVRIFLENFERKVLPFEKEIKKRNKTLFEILIVASMLEKEVRGKENKKLVAGLLFKRLRNNMLLQVDATVNYALKQNKTRISLQDLKVDSPYNTYKYPGLPKGPISNPSLESIEAAVFPQESDFWFYLTTKEGSVIFSKTFAEHLKNKIIYLKND